MVLKRELLLANRNRTQQAIGPGPINALIDDDDNNSRPHHD